MGARLVLVTAPSADSASALATRILSSKLAACVTILQEARSLYWWQGKIEESQEQLLIIKTAELRLEALEALIREHHPYDLPEFVVIDPSYVEKRYLDWLTEATA